MSFPVGGERYGVRPDIPTKARTGGDIHVGDEVEIEVIEITPEEVDAPSHVIREKECTVPSPDENEDDPKIWEQKLYDYLQYKKILEDEGLIERE